MVSSEVLGVSAAILYLISAAVLLGPLLRGANSRHKLLTLLVASIGILLHGSMLLSAIVLENSLNFNFINALSLTAWLMTLILILLSLRHPIEALGVVVLPISAMTVLTTSYYDPSAITIDIELQSHILFSVTAYCLLGLGALQALVVSTQSRHLRNHKPGGFIRALPPLNSMERILFTLLTAGFIMLSLSLLSGFTFLDDMFAQHLVHKTILSLAAWALFGILLLGRWRYGWRGKLAVKWTLWAFTLLILAYFGSKFVFEILLSSST